MKLTLFHKGDPISNTQLLEHSVFCSMKLKQLNHGAMDCFTVRSVVISWFCAVLQCGRGAQRALADISVRLSIVSLNGTFLFRKKTIVFCSICLFFASGATPQLARYTRSFVDLTIS